MELNAGPYRRLWQLSVVSFLIAALTGCLYRLGMFYPINEWLSLGNIRHAHTHLMFFNWVTPPLMIFGSTLVLNEGDQKGIQKFKICLYTMIGLGFIAWVFFLFFGYGSAQILGIRLPIAAMISGVIMMTWYWFATVYFLKRKDAYPSIAIKMFDAALIMLIISSLGAWGVSLFQLGNFENPMISSALTHFFLSVFTEGWVVIGILALIWSTIKEKKRIVKSELLWVPIMFGSMMIFPFSLSINLITPAMLYTAKLGIILISVSLVLNLFVFLERATLKGFIWKIIILLIGLKALILFIAALPFDIWAGQHGLRVLYLHIVLLGIASITIIHRFHLNEMELVKSFFIGSIVLILISLTMISGYWPSDFIPDDIYQWILVISFIPVIPVSWLLLKHANRFKRS